MYLRAVEILICHTEIEVNGSTFFGFAQNALHDFQNYSIELIVALSSTNYLKNWVFFFLLVTCGSPPSLTNGRYVMENPYFEGDFNQFTVGQKFLYTCEYGYRSNGGDRYAVCGDEGTWIGPELKCEGKNWHIKLFDRKDI